MSHNFTTGEWLRQQWSNPSDIFTILLIIGGDVVRAAVAQLCVGPVRFITPVTFSFGWVSYAVTSMLSAIGDSPLMPEPENDCLIISARNGYVQDNYSWVLSRLWRDFDYWKPEQVTQREDEKRAQRAREMDAAGVSHNFAPQDSGIFRRSRSRFGLTVSVFKSGVASTNVRGDIIYYLGFVVAVVQLAVAIVPWALYDEWLTFLVTASGTMLAFLSGSLPQWRDEKIEVRRLSESMGNRGSANVMITAGNGSQDVLLILGTAGGLDFTALASPYRPLTWRWTTRAMSLTFAVLWIVLLISIAGYDQHTWYLLSVGLIGLFHNVLAASAKRRPEPCGIKLEYVDTIVEQKVMETLWKTEAFYPGAGAALLPIFFPGQLFPNEIELWDYAKRRADDWRKQRNIIDIREFEWKMPPIRQRDVRVNIPSDSPYTESMATRDRVPVIPS